MIVMEGDAIIEQYAGGYDDYINQKHENLTGKIQKTLRIKIEIKISKNISKALI